jgi:hypothetical protein
MKRFVMRYPGDPPVEVRQMNRQEFLREFPRTPMLINGEVLHEFGPDEIYCGLCAKDPGDEIFVCRQRAHCRECHDQYDKPYCKELTT